MIRLLLIDDPRKPSLVGATYTAVAQESPGTTTLAAAELVCAGQGWNVTVRASDWARESGGPVIPANAFTLTQVENPAAISGQGITALGGPKLVNNLATLNLSRKVLQADARHLQGGGDDHDFDKPLAASPLFTRSTLLKPTALSPERNIPSAPA